jgi:NitT/TauT family transport system substrate-binding protein
MGRALRISVLAAAGIMASAQSAAALDKVTYNMAWLPQGSSIGVMVAKEKGYFEQAGLDVNIIRGYGGNRTANELDQGLFEFGHVDAISMLLSRKNGGKIRFIGATNTRSPAAICYVKERRQPKNIDDLKGLVMGGGSASPVQQVVPAWLELNGKPKDFIRLLRMDPAVVDSSLVEGKIDLAECWAASNRAVILKLAAKAGVTIGWINYSDYGMNVFGAGIATREELLKNKPDLVRKFLTATYKGYAFAIAQPEQAADIMVKLFPNADRGIALQQIREIDDLIVDPEVRDRGLGYMRDDRMRSTVQFIGKAFELNGSVKAEDTFTNDFLK